MISSCHVGGGAMGKKDAEGLARAESGRGVGGGEGGQEGWGMGRGGWQRGLGDREGESGSRQW